MNLSIYIKKKNLTKLLQEYEKNVIINKNKIILLTKKNANDIMSSEKFTRYIMDS